MKKFYPQYVNLSPFMSVFYGNFFNRKPEILLIIKKQDCGIDSSIKTTVYDERKNPIWRPQRNYNLEYFDSINLTMFLKQTAPELVILRVRDYH